MSKLVVEIGPPTPADVMFIADNLREADVVEVNAATGKTDMHEALHNAVRMSDEVWVGRVYKVPVCIWGVAPMSRITQNGSPWLVGTDRVKKYQKAFLRRNKAWLDAVKKRYKMLYNFVDIRNPVSIKWIQWLGFDVLPAKPYGVKQTLFHRFEMQGEV